jgi:DNA-binding transcriptional LysR family regulator
MIEIHLLRQALAAADTGSLRQAADRFRIKQSTLSKHFLYLEQRLGLSSFARSTRGVVPTEPSTAFLDRVRCIVDDVDVLDHDTSAMPNVLKVFPVEFTLSSVPIQAIR